MDRPERGVDGVGPVTGAPAERRNVAGRPPAPSLVDQARCWVDQSCVEQGLPSKVADESVLRNVAVLLAGGSDGGPHSGSPSGRYACRVEGVAAPDGRADDDPLEESRDDRTLPGGGQGVPLAS
jgi:hypothetical protein